MGSFGKVWLVGAGPGDPGLLTLKGRDALRLCEVVFFDRLVNPAILLLANPRARWVDVGKEPKGQRTEQSEICKKMIRAARQGQMVVRLKGGDPFVFGRGGEEAMALAKEKIPFEIVPGVTSGIAVPAREGIPVTHRGLSTELSLQIGARAQGAVSGKTLVGYMSVDGLGDFLDKAKQNGFSRKTPAALISKGTWVDQRSVFSDVGNLEKAAKRKKIKAPALVVVGDVVRLRSQIGRQCTGRLAGKRVVLTVSESLGHGWREVLDKEGAEVWSVPMTRIEHLPFLPVWRKKIESAQWIVLTSGAGARALLHVVEDLRNLSGKRIAVVGKSTAGILASLGLKADFTGRGPGAEALARHWPGNKGERVLHLTGDTEEGGFSRYLRRRGYRVERLVVYRNVQPDLCSPHVRETLHRVGADWVIFVSGTASLRFGRFMGKSWMRRTRAAVIGPATARVARKAGWRVQAMAKDVSATAVVNAILKRA